MGQSLAKAPSHIRRAQRISLFCKQARRYLLNYCLDFNLSYRLVDTYIEEMFLSMETAECEYQLDILVAMLFDKGFLTNMVEHYKITLSES